MQIHKPMCLGIASRPIEYRKRFGLCISAYMHVPFNQPAEGCLWGEQSMWDFLSQEMAQPLIDEGVSKLHAEFLIHGKAYAQPGRSNGVAVRAKVGGIEKTLLVLGDRYWDGEQPSAAAAFESIPINWERAYGGADFALNPAGKGRQPEAGVTWLPNIESPSERLLRPGQSVRPAGWCALDGAHPLRAQHRGTYDEDYLKAHSPGFAPDMDWRFFNLAPEDQWLPQGWRGDEPFSFDHMHPLQAQVSGRLPGLKARVFASYERSEGREMLKEVPLRLSTVWFFPHAERSILIFHGLAKVSSDDGADIKMLMGAVERQGQPRDDAHYADVLLRREDPMMGGVYSLDDSELLPEGLDTTDPVAEGAREAFASEGLQAKAQRIRAETDVAIARDNAQLMGLDPDVLGIQLPPQEAPPKLHELAAYLKKNAAEIEKQRWAMLEDAVTQAEKALELMEKQQIPPTALVQRGPPGFSAEAKLDELKAALAMQGKVLQTQAVYPNLIKLEAAERQGYLQSAHAQAPALPMPEAEAQALREEIERALGRGWKNFAELDFTGADFSGLDLRGCSFVGAWLESANFTQANVSGVDFSGAVLAHANLTQWVAVGSRFVGANLGRTKLQYAVFDEAELERAILIGCDFSEAQFRRANLHKALLLECVWGHADFTGAQLPQQLFHKAKLQKVCFAEAGLAGATFVECDMVGADLHAANLMQASFMTCKLDEARLSQVRAEGAVFVQGCTLKQANLEHAVLRKSNLAQVSMQGARLKRAVLDDAHLSGAQMSGVDLRLASAKSALLRKTVLCNAQMGGINLKNALLQQADLRGADLRRSNLYGADLSRVRLDADVQLDEALLTRTRTWPRLTPEQQAAP